MCLSKIETAGARNENYTRSQYSSRALIDSAPTMLTSVNIFV